MSSDAQQLLITCLIGIVAGWLASLLVGGGGLIQYLVSGVLGAFVGGYLLSALGLNLGIQNPLMSRIAVSTIGAIVVVILARLIL